MSQTFATITTKTNSDFVTADWFNALQAAGANIESFLGGFITEQIFTVANNQVAAANITGLAFSSASYKAARVEVNIRRQTDTGSSEVIAIGVLTVSYRNQTATWDITTSLNGDDTGVVLSITSAGQIQYTSSNIAGTNYVGVLHYKATTFSV